MGIQIKGIAGQYSGYSVDVARVRQKLEEQITVQYPQDTAEISEAGKRALKNEMSTMSTERQFAVAGHLSSVSSYEYCSRFEKELTELKRDNDTKTNCFEYHVNKMVSVYEKMKADLEVKYDGDSETAEYYVSEDGSIAQLTKEKELEFLQNAYEKHSLLMATSTGIWAELAENYGGVKLAENLEGEEIEKLAYQAFLSAGSRENRLLVSQAKDELDKLRLNLNITSGARNWLNQIWDYYADDN